MKFWNDKRSKLRRTSALGKLSNVIRIASIRPCAMEPPAKLVLGLTVIVLLGLLAGCATTSLPPSVTPRNPEPPPSRLQAQPPSYSASASRNIEAWRKTLIERTAKPAN